MELSYRLISANPYDTFDDATPWIGQFSKWRLALDNGRLTATTDEPFDSEAAARAALEPLLRAWAVVAFLTGHYEVAFVADGVEPEPPVPSARERIYMRANKSYPAPDPDFSLTSTSEHLLEVLRAFESGVMPLPETVSETSIVLGRSAEAAGETTGAAYNVEQEVVEKLDELSKRDGIYRGPEWQWMQEALRLLTLQAGRRDDSPPANRLTMGDFRTELAITDLQRRSL